MNNKNSGSELNNKWRAVAAQTTQCRNATVKYYRHRAWAYTNGSGTEDEVMNDIRRKVGITGVSQRTPVILCKQVSK